jgi:TctA family transporter
MGVQRHACVDRGGFLFRDLSALVENSASRGPLWFLTMDIFQGLLYGFQVVLNRSTFSTALSGLSDPGGVLPGLGPAAAIALLLPSTFAASPVSAIIMLAGIYCGAMYGGSTASILVNIPGEAASVVTCLDGHAMARQGRAGAALGISALDRSSPGH